MVNFVLNDLGGPAGKGFDAGLKLLVLPLYLNGLVTLVRTRAAQQRKATFFCVVRIGLLLSLVYRNEKNHRHTALLFRLYHMSWI